ncbi:MAG: hypothetical protein CVT95_09865, partial [Bacteroidetes bacterium HGW-Bacteroidetes-12]
MFKTNLLNEKGSLFNQTPFGTLVKIFLLLWLGGFFVYGVDSQIARTFYFSLVFIMFLYSKNNLFWLAFFWIMILNPWGLFYYRWNSWILPLTPTVGIDY